MLEDAVKATRTIHRLLIAASLVGLVFVLSLEHPARELRLVKGLDRLMAFPVREYDRYIDGLVDAEVGEQLRTSAGRIGTTLAGLRLQVFGLERIAFAFEHPAHVGRVISDELAIADLPHATLEMLDLFGETLPLDQEVQVVIADPDRAARTVIEFIRKNAARGPLGLQTGRVENVQLGLYDGHDRIGETFLAVDGVSTCILSFELHQDSGSTPIFQEMIPGRLVEIPGSAWLTWLRTRLGLEGVVSAEGELTWLPDAGLTTNERTTELGSLRQNLQQEIDNAKAKNQTIDLPGVKVPGSLALLAIPLALVGIAFYLYAHLGHLQRLLPRHVGALREFAWMPLALRAKWWFLEPAWSLLALPGAVMVALAIRSRAFAAPQAAVIGVATIGVAASATIGIRIILKLAAIRREIARCEEDEPELFQV